MRESIRRKRNKYILKKQFLKKISHCQQTSYEYIERESMYIYIN